MDCPSYYEKTLLELCIDHGIGSFDWSPVKTTKTESAVKLGVADSVKMICYFRIPHARLPTMPGFEVETMQG